MRTMKNKIALVSVLLVMIAAVLGCSSINPLAEKPVANTPSTNKSAKTTTANTNTANKSLADQAIDTAIGQSKLGVPECDEAMDMLTAYGSNPDDNFAVRATKALVVNQIKESIKQAVEENQTDKAQLATVCKEAKVELEKYKAKENAPK